MPNNNTTDKESLRCSFCGKKPDQVEALVQGPDGINICNECIEVCSRAMEEDLGYNPMADRIMSRLYAPGGPFSYAEDFQPQSSVDRDSEEADVRELLGQIPTPHEIYKSLCDYVVGQDDAKRTLSVAVYNHYKRIALSPNEQGDATLKEDSKKQSSASSAGKTQKGQAAKTSTGAEKIFDTQLGSSAAQVVEDAQDVEIDKSNILLLGSTGSGKTLLAQTLARILKVPFAIADATTLTEAGYVGEDVENILLKLITAADFDIPLAEIGIVYIDEIDKIARKAENLSITRDVSGEGVQQALLKIMEGCDASVPPQGGRKHPHQELIHIDTHNILFILGGAFVGLADIVGQRVGKKGLGFNSESPKNKKQSDEELLKQVLPEDLNKFGMIPEFVGRIPVITSLNDLSKEDLVRILTEPKNCLVKQYKKMFAMENCILEFSSSALEAIASEAEERGTGARGLRSICERVLLDVMYNLPEVEEECRVKVEENAITKGVQPEITSMSGKVLKKGK